MVLGRGPAGRSRQIFREESVKTCTRCKESKPLSDFYPYRGRPMSWCKRCSNAAGCAWSKRVHRPNVEAAERAKRERNELLAKGLKFCTGCQTTKPVDKFGIDKATWSGRRTRCRDCQVPLQRSADQKRYRSDPEFYRAKARASHRRCYARNPKLALEKAKRYHAEWKARDPEGYRRNQRASCRTHRARKKGAATERVDYERICRRDRMRCHICKRRVQKDQLHFDHVIPLAAGGAHAESNIAVSHAKCNHSKNARVLTLF